MVQLFQLLSDPVKDKSSSDFSACFMFWLETGMEWFRDPVDC